MSWHSDLNHRTKPCVHENMSPFRIMGQRLAVPCKA